MENTAFLRLISIKTTIKELVEGTYVQEKEENPNYLQTKSHQKIYRLSVVATVLNKEKVGTITNFLIDDGTGEIALRSFEESKVTQQTQIGNTVLIIGKVRVYNQEKYISPEIIKKINPLWLKVRALEMPDHFQDKRGNLVIKDLGVKENYILNGSKENTWKNTVSKREEPKGENEEEEIGEEEIVEENGLGSAFPSQKIIILIKELDKGDGAAIEEILEKSLVQGTEQIIEKMLEKGDIFKISPGKVKVL
ncbi:TPA: hypothetical protein HA242_02340 [Candidatus Woesearchaeota archaeon]|nr:hypothetical protein [Candidatus Woesearchaeota archaeon]HIH12539.1 hypothetical protein [Candidatus Woesearchaeota archaeon]